MKTRITLSEVWFPSLPNVATKCTVDGQSVTRGEYIALRSKASRVVAEESHAAGGKTTHWMIIEVDGTE